MSLIESILKRQGGTIVEIGDKQYHFKPQASGAHVALVEDEAHARRFLAIREGYRAYKGPMSETPESAAIIDFAPKPRPVLNGSSVHPATFEIGGKTVSLGEVVAGAFDNQATQNNMSIAQWNDLSEDARHDLIDQQLDYMAEKAEGDDGDDNAEDPSQASPQGKPMTERQGLVLQYKAKFGKAPAHKMKTEEIKAALEA